MHKLGVVLLARASCLYGRARRTAPEPVLVRHGTGGCRTEIRDRRIRSGVYTTLF